MLSVKEGWEMASFSVETILGLLIPFTGTAAGSACVFFMRRELKQSVQKALTGFASGVMTAASIWSLLIPAMSQSIDMGSWAFLPAVIGFWLGILFLFALDRVIPHLHMFAEKAEGPRTRLARTTMMVLAVTLHNIHIIPALGDIRLLDLRASTIQKFLNQCKKVDRLSEKSVKNIRLVLHKALEQAIEDDQLKKNRCDRAKDPSYDDPPM